MAYNYCTEARGLSAICAMHSECTCYNQFISRGHSNITVLDNPRHSSIPSLFQTIVIVIASICSVYSITVQFNTLAQTQWAESNQLAWTEEWLAGHKMLGPRTTAKQPHPTTAAVNAKQLHSTKRSSPPHHTNTAAKSRFYMLIVKPSVHGEA